MTATVKKPRETANQRREREAAELAAQRAAELAKALEEWPARLMRNLGRVTKEGWRLRVEGDFFVVQSNDRREQHQVRLVPQGELYSWGGAGGDWAQMANLEDDLNEAEAVRKEAERRAALRMAALMKLSAEERQALGL